MRVVHEITFSIKDIERENVRLAQEMILTGSPAIVYTHRVHGKTVTEVTLPNE